MGMVASDVIYTKAIVPWVGARSMTKMELHTYVRSLDDNGMFGVLSMKDDAGLYAKMRSAFHAFIHDLDISIESTLHFLNEFFAGVDMPESKKNILCNAQDVRRYIQVHDEYVLDTQYSLSKSMVLTVTQVFTLEDQYVGAWLTCMEGTRDSLIWIVVDDDWETEVVEDIEKVREHFFDLVDGAFYFTVYGNTSGWPQLYSGTKVLPDREDAGIAT